MKLPSSSFGCPLDSLLRILSGPWTIYILCRLHQNGKTRFGELKRQMPGISSKMLTERLRSLEKAEIIDRHQEPTVPPKVTYELTMEGRELTTILDQINTLAYRWQDMGKKGKKIKKPESGTVNGLALSRSEPLSRRSDERKIRQRQSAIV